MKKVLITGANSYIGDSVAEYLGGFLDEYAVSVKDTLDWTPQPSDFENIDVVFNVAGIAHIKETSENRMLYYKVNRDLSIAIATAAKEAGVKQFILLSTMSVYGLVTGHITKNTEPNPVNAYGKSKLEADKAIDKLSNESVGKFKFCCLRPPMVYGKGCKGNYQSLRKFALNSPVFPKYENQRSMIYIGNLCSFVKNCIDRELHGLFFPQNAEYVRTSDMVRLIAENHEKKIRVTSLFNLGIFAARKVNVIKKVFGSLTYEKTDLVDKYGFKESIDLTEAPNHNLSKDNSNMRILATCQYGWPEPYPSLYPMEEMAKRGHYVHCVTGTPNYPMGEIFEGYEHNRIKKEEHNGLYISHVPVIPRKHDAIHRFLNYHSYPITAKKKLLSLKDNYDVVFANQSSPVMMVEPAIAYSKQHHKKVVMYCMDLWPASLCVGGVKRDSLLYKFYWKLSKHVYSNVDVILITSRMFKDYLITEFNIPAEKIEYLPQYALSEFSDVPESEEKDTTDFVFAGNVGKAQNLGVILRAAKIVQNENIEDHGRKIVFHIVGDGQALDELQTFARDNSIHNVIFHGRKPSKDMPKYYAIADAMIVTMISDPLVSLTLPAKVQSYMAAKKPIIASADGEIKNVINEAECGFCSKADDEKAFVEIIKAFITTENREIMGIKALKYYEANFSVEKVMNKLERTLRENCN